MPYQIKESEASNVNNARSDKCNRVGGCGKRLYLSSLCLFIFHRSFLIKNSFCRRVRSTHQDKAAPETCNKRASHRVKSKAATMREAGGSDDVRTCMVH